MKEKKEIQKYKKNEVDIKQTAWNSLSENSQSSYNSDYKIFFDFIKKEATDIVANDILLYVEHLRDEGYKNSSINRKIASLSKLFKVMIVAGEIKDNPVDMLKQFKNISFKTSKEVKVSITIQDIRKAIRNPIEKDKVIVPVIRMLARSGLRISELINIKNRDIENHDDGNYIVRIVGKGRKERFIFIDKDFFNEIKKVFPDTDSEYLFYNTKLKPFSRKFLWLYIRNFFKRKIDKKVYPHMLRHFYATHKINTEKQDIKAVSKFLGHSSVSITLDAYVDTALDADKSKLKI